MRFLAIIVIIAIFLLQPILFVNIVFGYEHTTMEYDSVLKQINKKNILSDILAHKVLMVHVIMLEEILVGNSPLGVSVNQDTDMVYVTNHDSDSVSVINSITNDIVYTIDVGSGPVGVAVNPNTNMIYVTNYYSDDVSVIDGSTNSVVNTVAVGDSPWGIAVNPNTNMVYVTNYFSNTISIIDGSTNNVINTIAVSKPWGIAVNPNTNMIYVVNRNSLNIAVIDGSNNVVDTVAVSNDPFKINPVGVAVNPNTNMIYVTNIGTITVINGSTNIPVANIVGDKSVGVAVNPNTNMIYVTNIASDNIFVIDGSTNNIVDTIDVGEYPLGLSINPNISRIYVANEYSDSISVIGMPKNQFIVSSNFNGTTYTVNGTSENVKIMSFKINPNHSVEFELTGQGEIELTIPNNMISRIHTIGSADQVIPFEETSTNASSTTIKFTVPNNTNSVEFLGITVVPEFSLLVTLVLVVSMLILLGFTTITGSTRIIFLDR